MAIVVLVLWLFTGAAGLYLLVTSNLSRARPARPAPVHATTEAAVHATAEPSATAAPHTTQVSQATKGTPAPQAVGAAAASRRAVRHQFDPPSLVAARNAPAVPEVRSLLEFAHPLCALAGLAFWLGFTLVHNRVLGWIAFGLVAVTACAGLAWFTANARAARRRDHGAPAPSFSGRLIALHGGAAALTVTLAALTALLAKG